MPYEIKPTFQNQERLWLHAALAMCNRVSCRRPHGIRSTKFYNLTFSNSVYCLSKFKHRSLVTHVAMLLTFIRTKWFVPCIEYVCLPAKTDTSRLETRDWSVERAYYQLLRVMTGLLPKNCTMYVVTSRLVFDHRMSLWVCSLTSGLLVLIGYNPPGCWIEASEAWFVWSTLYQMRCNYISKDIGQRDGSLYLIEAMDVQKDSKLRWIRVIWDIEVRQSTV